MTFKKLIAATLVALTLLPVQMVNAAPVLSVEPSISSIGVGNSFQVGIRISDIVDLYTFNFSVLFDASRLEATDQSEGGFLASAGSTFFIPGLIDNSLGIVSFVGNSLLGAAGGANGSGVLVEMTFKSIMAGSSAIDLADVLLLDSQFIDISAGTRGATATASAGLVPEPPTIILFGLALAAIIGRRGLRSTKMSTARYALDEVNTNCVGNLRVS